MDIQFNIDTACNMKCLYCNSRGRRIFKTSDILKTINSLFMVYKQRPHDDENILYFHGGEASLHKDVVPIVQHIDRLRTVLRPPNFVVEFQTNLSFDLDRYMRIGEYIDAFSITFHYSELKRLGLLDRFLNNLAKIAQVHKIYNLDIMLEPVEDVEEFHRIILDFVYPYALKAKHSEMIYGFYAYSGNEEAAKKNLDFYKAYNITERAYKWDNLETSKTTNELFSAHYDCKGMMCEAGVNAFNVFGNGDVYRCGAHSYIWMEREKGIHHYGPWKPLCNILQGPQPLLDYAKIVRPCMWKQCCGDFYVKRYYAK